MKIKTLKLSEIKPYENNPRINDHAVAAVANSIKEFGYRQPIVVDVDDVIIVGHTRLKALKTLYEDNYEVPVIVAEELTAKQVDAYRITDNKVGEISEWSIPELSYEIANLNEDFDFTKLGWSNKELKILLGEEEPEKGETTDDKLVISVGKDKIVVKDSEFEVWERKFHEENGKTLINYLLDELKLFPLKRRYELTR